MERLFAILGIVVFIAAAGRLGRRYGAICDRGAWRALLFGIVAARVGFVVRNWAAFAAEPVAIVQVWQGGFSPWAGLFAAAIALAVSLRRSPAFRPMELSVRCELVSAWRSLPGRS
ncbi:prolipoprotein diacylglyceryl transferase family protein [Sphingomonas flavalba]|uniref:prolipoprotein diacylglyceryl transferase family protein n=1 Tax=Sphingomonas flavalba TaxID=2559804 RepID=UPI0039DF8255